MSPTSVFILVTVSFWFGVACTIVAVVAIRRNSAKISDKAQQASAAIDKIVK